MRTPKQDTAELSQSAETHSLRFALLESPPGRPSSTLTLNRLEQRVVGSVANRPLTDASRLSDVFFDVARCYATDTALVTRRAEYSYADLAGQALCEADHLLRDEHYQPGDRVALMLDNGPEFIAALYGILAAGGVLVPLPANVERCRLEQISRICGVTNVLSSRPIFRKRRAELAVDECASVELSDTSRPTLPAVEPLRVEGHSLAMIMFTSGSSGEPKGVMLSDRNLLANTESILQYLPIARDDRALALLPFYHAFGHSILQTHLLSGATLVVDGNMVFPNTIVDALEKHHATSFSAVPEGYYSLLLMSDLGERRLPHLRYMSVAGGALKPASVVEMASKIAPAEFYVMYGQTEASARLAFLPAELAQSHSHSMGRAIPGVELKVLDQQGREAAVNETGELCARGANVMLGYWNDPAGTQRVLTDGWLRTGDLACRDEDGWLYVKARKNDLVKVQGYRIHPREVEDAISPSFPGLRIIVVPYEYHGSTRLALYAVAAKVGGQLIEQLRHVCQRELPRHKVPSYIEILNQAPLNASMKLDRTALRRQAELHCDMAAESPDDSCPKRRMSA